MGYKTLIDAILQAVEQSGRSDRSISSAALGQTSGVASLRRGTDPRLSSVMALCRELGLEISIGRPDAVPAGISQALELRKDCKIEDAVKAIEDSRQWSIDAISALREETELHLECFRRETTKQWREILQEYRSANPDHLQSAPFHAVPFATDMRATGKPGEVEITLSPVGRSFTRSQIEGWAEWVRLVCLEDPVRNGDLIVLEMLGTPRLKNDLVILDTSNPELLPGAGFTYLALSGDGLVMRRLRHDSGRADIGQSSTRVLGVGDWVVGRIAARIPIVADH